MRCTYYCFFDTMEEDPLNVFFVLKQNENVEIDCLQASRVRALREASGAQDVTLCASITQLSLSYQQ